MCIPETVDLSLPQDYEGFSAGQKRHLSRQAFLRSYRFCVEETFKDRLTRYSLRLKDESFEEIVKDSVRKLISAAKGFNGRKEMIIKFVRAAKGFKVQHCENLCVRKLKKKMGMSWRGACFRPLCKLDARLDPSFSIFSPPF